MPDRYFEEHAVGDRFESNGRTIREADIVNFAGVSGDFHPAAMDREFARRRYGVDGMWAHGALVFTAAIGLAWQMKMNTQNFTYGFDRMRFPRPVLVGDTIRVVGTVTECSDYPKQPNLGRVVMHLEVLNQKDKVVLALDHVMLIARRSGVESTAKLGSSES
jgi:acyl dehydratase